MPQSVTYVKPNSIGFDQQANFSIDNHHYHTSFLALCWSRHTVHYLFSAYFRNQTWSYLESSIRFLSGSLRYTEAMAP